MDAFSSIMYLYQTQLCICIKRMCCELLVGMSHLALKAIAHIIFNDKS